jgi:hypothetical protein
MKRFQDVQGSISAPETHTFHATELPTHTACRLFSDGIPATYIALEDPCGCEVLHVHLK